MPSNDNKDQKKNVTNKTRKDAYWHIRVSDKLDAALNDYLEDRGIRNKSEFIRILVNLYIDISKSENISKMELWKELVEEYFD